MDSQTWQNKTLQEKCIFVKEHLRELIDLKHIDQTDKLMYSKLKRKKEIKQTIKTIIKLESIDKDLSKLTNTHHEKNWANFGGY